MLSVIVSRPHSSALGERNNNMANETDESINVSKESTTEHKRLIAHRRPRSLTIVALIILVLFGGGYFFAIASLLTDAEGLSLSRLIVEPPEEHGGIPWLGWDEIGSMLKGKVDTLESLPARYWWKKLNLSGSLLAGPLFIIGFLGVFIGREWGRTCLYVYIAAWLANKVIYLLLMGAAGVFKFSIAVGMAVLLILVLRSKSWAGWIEQKPSPH